MSARNPTKTSMNILTTILTIYLGEKLIKLFSFRVVIRRLFTLPPSADENVYTEIGLSY